MVVIGELFEAVTADAGGNSVGHERGIRDGNPRVRALGEMTMALHEQLRQRPAPLGRSAGFLAWGSRLPVPRQSRVKARASRVPKFVG